MKRGPSVFSLIDKACLKRGSLKTTFVEIYTDGSCIGNPGPGGYAAILRFSDDREIVFKGQEKHTTNNIMELKAVLDALQYVKKEKLHYENAVHVYTDSMYVKDGITVWINAWKKKNWKNSKRKPIKNLILWQTLDRLHIEFKAITSVSWFWIRGHSGHEMNERVNALAQEQANLIASEIKTSV